MQLSINFMAAAKRKFLYYCFLFLQFTFSNSADTITTNQSFKQDDLLVSQGNNFAFGFFSPGSSSNRYLGIWFHKVSERSVVWVANRNDPITGSSAVLSFNQYGNLLLYNDSDQQVLLWTTNVTEAVTVTCVAQLLDTGNLVLLEEASKRIVWQSFDHPTDTMLLGMRFGQSKKAGKEWHLTSWRSANDPATGDYTFKLNPVGSPQFIIYKESRPRWRTHLWPARKFSSVYNYTYIINKDEMYTLWDINDPSVIIRIMVDYLGSFKWITWHQSDGQWKEFWSVPKYPCDFYAQCGANSKCSPSNPDVFECACLPGFEPKFPKDWYLRDASGGCVRKRLVTSSVCRHGEGFVKVKDVKFPDTSTAAWVGTNMRHRDCEQQCLRNCSCSAYSVVEKDEKETGCLAWYGELIDMVDHMNGNLDMYIRVDAIELAENARKSNSFIGKKAQNILIASVGVAWFTIFFFVYLWFRRRRKKGIKKKWGDRMFDPVSGSIYYKNTMVASEIGGDTHPPDIIFFDLSSIVAATNNFSPTNKLGQGGFGSVYKGQLFNGQEVAVKRLSKNSEQGIEEFKNEVMLIAKLQHRNLVKLLGCCVDGREQMLIYEYLPNKSLDLFLFDQKSSILDWRKRCIIINGVARGILYLHQDSRLRIIHRDLKSSNILLDAEMNPKISDFGMARIFRADQIQDRTNRVVGTYGYMSPEYAVFGKFSIKSDVFSFGVITLEIITSKNNGFHQTDTSLSLIGHVWYLWKEGRVLEIVDSKLEGLYSPHEALRSIQIGLLCVQENVEDRPTMLEVVLMLSSDGALPVPKQPPFVFTTSCSTTSSLESGEGSSSINEVTINKFEAR